MELSSLVLMVIGIGMEFGQPILRPKPLLMSNSNLFPFGKFVL